MAGKKALPVIDAAAEETQEAAAEGIEEGNEEGKEEGQEETVPSPVDPEGAQLVVPAEDNIWLMAAGPHEVYNPYTNQRFSVGKPAFVQRLDGYLKTQGEAGLLIKVDPSKVALAQVGNLKED